MQLHPTALKLAQNILLSEAQLLEVLIRMKSSGEYLSLGFRNVFEYVVRCLRLSEAQGYYYQKVIEKSVEVPALKEAVISGQLSLSKARRIVPIIDSRNASEWIEKASSLKQRDLEKAVAEVNPAQVREKLKPVGPALIEMVVGISPDVEALLKRVRDLESQRTRKDASWNEVLKTLAEGFLTQKDPLKKAQKLAQKKIKPTLIKPGRRAVIRGVAHRVTLRDQGQCVATYPDGNRCEEKRWLEKDHLLPVSQGGLNTVANLRTLCRFHHQRRHEKELTFLRKQVLSSVHK